MTSDPTPSLVVIATVLRFGQVALAAQLASRPWCSCPVRPPHRQHRGQLPDPPARWPDLPKPSLPATHYPEHGAPSPPRLPPPLRCSPRTLPLFPGPRAFPDALPVSGARCRLFSARCCRHTWPRAEAGWPQAPLSVAPARLRRLCVPRPGPRPAAGPPSGRTHCSPDLSAARKGPPGARLAFLPREGRRGLASRAISMRKKRRGASLGIHRVP